MPHGVISVVLWGFLERKENSLNHWLNFDYLDVVNFLLLIHTILLLLYFL